MPYPLYTIGYATFSQTDFIKRLRDLSIGAVVDVRSEPTVSHFEGYRFPAIKKFVNENGIYYLPLSRELGARPVAAALYSDGKADFSKIARWTPFRASLKRLRDGIEKFPLCLMCAQKDPLNCHRSILITREFKRVYPEAEIFHIISQTALESEEELRKRLLKSKGFDQLMLGKTSDETLAEAYSRQEEEIAYRG